MSKPRKTWFFILFLCTFIFSIVIRISHLTEYPEGFDQTEAAFGYNAYSVLQTGRDEDGKFLPLVLVSIGDYKLSGYMYWQIPFIALFGLNEFATRLSTAVAGVISLLLIYYIVNYLFKSKKIALLTFFITSIAPWHIILSRMAYDPMIALMLLLASLALYINWNKTDHLFLLLGSALTLCWAIDTYYAVWVILPFVLILYFWWIFKKHYQVSKFIISLLILTLPLIIFFKLLSVTQGQRLGQDTTFQVNAYPLLLEQIREDQHEFPLLLARIYHNKLIFYPRILLQSFFNNLSFDFLFLRGDKIDKRFAVPFQGVLYLMYAPFLILGILYFWKNNSLLKNMFLLAPIGIIFFGSSFSEFGSETERTLFAVPLFSFLVSYGLLTVYFNLHKYQKSRTLIISTISVLLSISVFYFNHDYFWHTNVHEPWARDYGVKEMVLSLPSLKSQYNNIVVPDSSYIFFHFYNRVDPRVAWEESLSRHAQENFLGLNLRANTGEYLTMPIECPTKGKLNVLYICRGSKIPDNSKVLKVIRYRDEQPAFIFMEFTPQLSIEPPPKNLNFVKNLGLIDDESKNYW